MVLVPAIDMINGKCVRLVKGDYEKSTIYGDPVEIGRKWRDLGAERLHLVDLDGASSGNPDNLKVIEKLVAEVKVPLELGGGIRDMETIKKYLDMGVDRIILGTAAIENPALVACATAVYEDRIIIGIDALNGIVRTKGWLEDTQVTALSLAYDMKELGVARIIYTDISKDGTLEGPNLEETKRLAEATGLKVTASGGMSSLSDVERVMTLEASGVDEVILGKALYEGKIDFTEAQNVVKEK